MTTTTFETAKVGDRVWSVEFGWGEVKFLDFCETYPIRVMHSDDKWESYMLEGKRLMSQTCQTLFWDEVVIEAPVKPMPRLAVDAKILVWDVPEVKHKRHFSHFDEYGYIYTFTDGKTSFTSRSTEVSKWLDWDFAE